MDKLHINFVSQGSAYLASHKMRVQKPTELLNVGVTDIQATITTMGVKEADLNVFSKHFDKIGNLRDITSAKYYSIFDVCDDHFSRDAHSEYYKMMCSRADLVTCNTENMKKRILEETQKEAFVIPDPITFPRGDQRVLAKGSTPKILWFGHSSNLEELYKWLPYIPYRVTVVSNVLTENHPNIDFIPWKPMVVENIIKDFDIVLLPTQKTPWVHCKSPNRAVDALYAGKTVITDNEDIYGTLGKYLFIIKDLEELTPLVSNGEHSVYSPIKLLKETYGDAAVLDTWLNAFIQTGIIKGIKDDKT